MRRGYEDAYRIAGVGPPEANGHGHHPIHNLTDLGNAERLVARHSHDLRYVHPWGKWLAWAGRRWAVDASGQVERLAVETVRAVSFRSAITG